MAIEWGAAGASNLKNQYNTIHNKLNTLKQHMDELDCDSDGTTNPTDQFPCDVYTKLDEMVQNVLNMANETVNAVINAANCIVKNDQTNDLHEKMLNKVNEKINTNTLMDSIINQLDNAIASDDCDYITNILNEICNNLDNEKNLLSQMLDAAANFKNLQMDVAVSYSQVAALVNCIKTELSSSPVTAGALQHVDPNMFSLQQYVSEQVSVDKKPGEIINNARNKINEIHNVDNKINDYLNKFL